MARSPNKYRNPERDRYYEELEKELKAQVNLERGEVVLKNQGFAVVDGQEDKGSEVTEEARIETSSKEDESWKKRYGDLQRHVASLQREWSEKESGYKSEIERLKSSTKTPDLPSDMSEDQIEEWKKKFPDVAKIIDAMAQKRAREIASGLEEKVSTLEQSKKKLDSQRAYLQLLSFHEDFDEIRQSQDFKDWLAVQHEDHRNAVVAPVDFSEASVRKAADVIDLFKFRTGWKTKGVEKKEEKKKEPDLSAARVTPSRGSDPEDYDTAPKFTESQIAKMSAKEFEKNQEAIMEAQRKGPPYFVHDMTGAAR